MVSTKSKSAVRRGTLKTDVELPIVHFPTKKAWAAWLAKHADTRGVWMKLAKKSSGLPSITYAEALDVALAWGWIDGQSKGVDALWWLQRYTPRGPKSLWSKINREHIARLTVAGEMKPRGLAEVERAKSDGRWDAAYSSPSRATVPEDLEVAFASAPRAKQFFQSLDATNRFAILHRIEIAKQAAIRARRISEFVAMLTKKETVHPVKAATRTKVSKPPPAKRTTNARTKPKGP